MEKVIIESKPDVESPVFAVALPGVGNVGLIALGFFSKFSGAKKFGHYYSKNFPDHVMIQGNGVCALPGFDFFASKSINPNMVIAISNTPITSEDSKSYYDVFDEIVGFAVEVHSRMLIALDAVAVASKSDEIYVAATTPRLLKDFSAFGAKPYEAKRLPGPVGLLLGLSEYHQLKGVGILGSAASFQPDNESGRRVYDFLAKALDLRRIDTPA